MTAGANAEKDPPTGYRSRKSSPALPCVKQPGMKLPFATAAATRCSGRCQANLYSTGLATAAGAKPAAAKPAAPKPKAKA